jgi:uncharacterized membrane protein
MDVYRLIIVVIAIAVLDGIWISSNIGMYRSMYSKIQGSPMNVNILGAILAYIFVFLVLAVIVIPYIEKTTRGSLFDCLKIGGVSGACVYAIYNFTNMATFKDYNIRVALMDTMWGGFLFTAVSYLALKLSIISIKND